MSFDFPSLILGVVLTGIASFIAAYLVNRMILGRRERRDDVLDLVAIIEESAAWVSDALQFHFAATADRSSEPEWGAIERDLRVRIFRGVRRLPEPLAKEKHLRGRAIRLNSYITNVFGLLRQVNRSKDDAVLWLNDEARALTDFLEEWLDGKRKPKLRPTPQYQDEPGP